MGGDGAHGIVARPGRDCATRVRVRYELPRALDELDGDVLPGAEVTLTAFSAWVNGARDHLRIALGAEVTLVGVVGERVLEATYGRFGGHHPAALVDAVERRLSTRWGPITRPI